MKNTALRKYIPQEQALLRNQLADTLRYLRRCDGYYIPIEYIVGH